MVDLEDGVAEGDKDTAREAAVDFLQRATGATVLVRINDPDTDSGRQDLAALAPLADLLSALIVPKSTQHSVAGVHEQVACPVVALVETALGVEEALGITKQGQVIGLLFGSVDYVTDIVAHGGWHLDDLSWVKSRLVNAAAAGGAWALAGPSTRLDASSDLEAELLADRRAGFAGKLCIHPSQVAAVNQAFAPSSEQFAWAQCVVEAVGQSDQGAVRLDGQMIDKPVVSRARRILAAGQAVAS